MDAGSVGLGVELAREIRVSVADATLNGARQIQERALAVLDGVLIARLNVAQLRVYRLFAVAGVLVVVNVDVSHSEPSHFALHDDSNRLAGCARSVNQHPRAARAVP